jgi:hypothetical protein
LLFADSLEKFEEFEDLKRAEGQTINEYIAVFDSACYFLSTPLKSHGFYLSKSLLGLPGNIKILKKIAKFLRIVVILRDLDILIQLLVDKKLGLPSKKIE